MEPAAHIRPGFVAIAVRRRWFMITVTALLGLLAGFGAARTIEVSYSSEASLFLNPVAGNPYQPEIGTARTDQLVALQTEGTLIATPEVAALAQTFSAVPLPDAAERQVQVSLPSNSQVIRVSFAASSPEVASAGAQAFADAYLDYRRQRAEQANLAQADQLQAQLDATSTVIGQTATALATTPADSSEELLLRQQLEVYSSQLAQLRLQLTEVLSAVPSTGEVINPATQSSTPSGLPPWTIAAGGLLAGLGLALLYVLAREHSDDRVHDAQELSGLGAGHPLATVPAGTAVLEVSKSSPEGYRLLLTVITGREVARTPVVCLLGSEGSSTSITVAAGLAAAAYRLGRSVLLVGADVEGLWSVSRELDPENVLKPGSAEGAPSILRLGSDAATTEAVAMSAALPEALVRARDGFDLVVLAGRTGSSALGWRFAALADRTLVVGELGRDTFTELLDLVETLRQSGVEDIAVVASTRARWDSRRRSRSTAAARTQPKRGQSQSTDIAGQVGEVQAAPELDDTSSARRQADSSVVTRIPRQDATGRALPAGSPRDQLTDRRAGR